MFFKNEELSKNFENFKFYNLDINAIDNLEISDIDCLINFAAGVMLIILYIILSCLLIQT